MISMNTTSTAPVGSWVTRPALATSSTAPEIGANYPTGFYLLAAFVAGAFAMKVL